MKARRDPTRWFRMAVWLGVAVNLVLAVPGIFWPNATLALAHQRLALETPVWPAFASLLLALLSIFYIPGAIDPRRYRATAILSVVARLAGVVFFLGLWRNLYPMFGYLDLFFLILQTPLLVFMIKSDRRRPTPIRVDELELAPALPFG